jgi:hypothetical protein
MGKESVAELKPTRNTSLSAQDLVRKRVENHRLTKSERETSRDRGWIEHLCTTAEKPSDKRMTTAGTKLDDTIERETCRYPEDRVPRVQASSQDNGSRLPAGGSS